MAKPAAKPAASKKPSAKVAKVAKPGAAVKKPLSGYMKFAKDRRPALIKEQPSLSFGEVGKALGAEWKKMSDAQKAKYK